MSKTRCFGDCPLTVTYLQFCEDYPSSAPHVQFLTTSGGKTRFNPNLYSDGKVCLSILGTWRGESGEMWSSVQNCHSVMLSIQSLLDDEPYHNEPGFEKQRCVGNDLVTPATFRSAEEVENVLTLDIALTAFTPDFSALQSQNNS
eukprot:768533-Hanusia_phi.AAC.1